MILCFSSGTVTLKSYEVRAAQNNANFRGGDISENKHACFF